MNLIAFPSRRRHGVGLARSIARAKRCEAAELISRGLLRVASVAPRDVAARITDLAYLEAAKADVLRALSDGHRGEALLTFAVWRALRRSIYGGVGRA